MEYDETVYACAINRIFNYNCRAARAVTDRFASPGELFSLPERELRELLHGNTHYIDAVLDGDCLRKADEEVRWARSKDVRIIYIRDKEYPRRLRECPDAPPVLFHKGCAGLNPSRAIAVVGTRKATGYGISQCRRIIEHLAGLKDRPLVISGLAYGIDITAHLAAMEYGLQTAAILPTGMDSIYPSPHRQYAVKILGQGCLITDFPKGATPMPVSFLRRNRIIAGMADAVILVESAEKGGGLVTAGIALSYSRDVFALPGKTTDKYSAGCNALIGRNAAAIITSPSCISEALNWNDSAAVSRKERLMQLFEKSDYIRRNILLALSADSAVARNTIIEKAGADPQEVLARLTEMEMEGTVGSDIFGNYILKV